jgi:DNA-binding response OmpR family regulator
MNKPRSLIVDDEPQMIGIIAYALETQGFEVMTAYDGQQALDRIKLVRPDLIVLDIMLPKVNGWEVCRQVRENTTIPVILLTAKTEDEDIIRGLELGADDYITKPFNPREVALRAQAILRRSNWGKNDPLISIGALEIDIANHRATLDHQPLQLTPHELSLLVCLAQNAGRVLSWQSILNTAWGIGVWDGGKEMVKTTIYRLRQKIETEPENPRYLLTVRGVGYTIPLSGD